MILLKRRDISIKEIVILMQNKTYKFKEKGIILMETTYKPKRNLQFAIKISPKQPKSNENRRNRNCSGKRLGDKKIVFLNTLTSIMCIK